MIQIQDQSFEQARINARLREYSDFRGQVTDLILPGGDEQLRTQAFYVEQVANWTLRPHYHLQHQFQVFLEGSGQFGKGAHIGPLTVHYAAPQSTYGPIISSERGLGYLTLRMQSDAGAWFIPESREKIDRTLKKKAVHAQPETPLNAAQLEALQATLEEVLIAPEPSGLAAWLLHVPPHQQASAPAGSELGGGRCYVVTMGALRANGKVHAALRTIFVSSDDTLNLEAGDSGLQVLVLQFQKEAD